MQVISQDKYKNCASQILEHELFPHCGIYTLKFEIAIILANMVSKMYHTFLIFVPNQTNTYYLCFS